MSAISGQDSVADLFISYTAADSAWAEWIAWQLENAGYSVLIQSWDFVPGKDFLHEMEKAAHSSRTIAVLSDNYNGSAFGEAEWRSAFAKDPTGEKGLLVPVLVSRCHLPSLLATRVYIDLTDKSAQDAKEILLNGVRGKGARPTIEPAYPGGDPPMFPGDLGPKHELLRLNGGRLKFPQGRTVIYFSRDPARGAAFASDRYGTVRELLDDLYVAYISDRFAPFTYGSSWILHTRNAWSPHDGARCIAPLEWLASAGTPISDVSKHWQNLTPAEAGICLNKAFIVEIPSNYRYCGIISDSPRVAEVLTRNPKAFYLIAHEPGPMRSLSEAPGQGHYVAVFTCESDRLAGKIMDLSGPMTQKIVNRF